MTDPIDYVSPRQRLALLILLTAYIGLFVVNVATRNEMAKVASDLLFGGLFVPGSVYAIARMREVGVEEPAPYVAAGGALFAGVSIGYTGLASLFSLPGARSTDVLGTLALLVALVAYFYWRKSS